jgi:hypothetical protein
METRRIELVCGVLGGALGLVALGVGLFAPLDMECTSLANQPGPGDCVRMSVVQSQGIASLQFVIALIAGLSLGILLFATWHSLARSLIALVLLWVCTVLLCFLTLIAIFSIGIFFVPADALALAASIIGIVVAQRRMPAHV